MNETLREEGFWLSMSKNLSSHLNNACSKNKADQLNLARERRKAGQELRMTKQYASLGRSSGPLKAAPKLEEHFSWHFGPHGYVTHPNLKHPESYPHILLREE